MKTEKGTIQWFMETNYPNHFASGKWGCKMIGFAHAEHLDLPKHGFQVSVGVAKKYWVWLDKD